jgi:hypothetical protein
MAPVSEAVTPSSQSRRPGFGRHASSSSYVSQSPSEGHGHGHPGSYRSGAGAHRAQKHVVGKLGRNVSSGKDLHKLGKRDGSDETRHHKRSSSGGASAPSSPKPAQMKRNPSGGLVKRNSSHTALRRNLSSGHLPRHGSSKNLAKHHTAPPMKRAHSHGGNKSAQPATSPMSPKAIPPTVRFAVPRNNAD